MKGKIGFVIGVGVGYLLGTPDGRQRVDQVAQKAKQLWQRPEVQDTVDEVAGRVSRTLRDDANGSSGDGDAASSR